jgi:hypothetical protein
MGRLRSAHLARSMFEWRVIRSMSPELNLALVLTERAYLPSHQVHQRSHRLRRS